MARNTENDTIETTGPLQREAWLRKQLPPVEQVRPDLWSIPVPMPLGPLRYVSVYALAGESAITLIDAGWDSEEAWDALGDGLTAIGAGVADVTGVLVTHQHVDHLGLAARLRERTGAWVALHGADRDLIARPEYRVPEQAAIADVEWLLRLGASPEEAQRLRYDDASRLMRARMALPDRLLCDGERLDLPGWQLRAVHTPGHTPGHTCFVAESRELLFAGDHLLPRISPNISVDYRDDVDALGDFLASLTKIAAYDTAEVLPAHEWRYRGAARRARALQAHHRQRLEEVRAVIAERPGSTPWQLAAHLTWSRPWDNYDGHMRIQAVNETAAHVVHLLRCGVIVREPQGGYRLL
jgi:glyoxylase-like metal-dependent hydrolase (beta-lactamase superfamily II)